MLDKSKKKRREKVSCLFLPCQLIANIRSYIPFHADCSYCLICDEMVAIY